MAALLKCHRMFRCATALLVCSALWLPTDTAVSALDESRQTPALAIVKASPYRSSSGALTFRIELAGKADPARFRIMLDVDGTRRGESSSGADFMVEGVNFYKYPKEAKGWDWEKMSPPLVLAKEHVLACILPDTFHVESARWYVETTDTKWATVDRFPKTGFADFKYADLPLLPTRDLARDAASPSLQIMDVTPFKVDGGLAFRVAFAAQPDPARFRLMLDTDQHHGREPNTGADYMIEGVNFYSYPAGASNWTWNIQAPPVIVAESNTLTYIVLDAPRTSSGKWVAETTNPDWSPADRFPPIGEAAFRTSTLPELKLDVRHRPEDVSELTNGPPSLSCRFGDTIKSRQWTASTLEPIWEVRSMRTSFPVRVVLYDVSSGQSAMAKPAGALQSGKRTRWDGTTLGIDWTLLAELDENGDVTVTGQLHSETNRCVRVAVGCAINPTGWTWHDDLRFRRSITLSDDPYGNVAASACGVRGEQSLYPFGVISSNRGVLVVETDPDEPRVFQVFAETAKKFFGVYYDLALTPATTKFPGNATFRCALRSLPPGGDNPFRRALAAFYQRNPAFCDRRVPTVGLWMPFSDISTIPHAEDFGFAFFEKEGKPGKDVDYCRAHEILTLGYTEPWLYWLPMPGKDRTEAAAIRRMKFYAAAGNDQRSEFAAAALQGAVCKPDGSIRMDFMDVPWNSGARMEVSTDPELTVTPESPINRAMSEWRHVKQVLADDRFDGVYLDSMSAMDTVDYNPAAIAVADYPCTYEAGVFRPGLSTKVAAYEYTAGLGQALARRGHYLMGNFPCWRFPFYMKYIDIPGEETTWWLGGRYQRLSDQQLIYRRAISGRKPYGFLQAANYEEFKGPLVDRYFRDCLFWGFLPSFFSADGASNPYWTKPEWYERDRHFFKTYVPIIRRLAAAGWQPLGPARSESENLWVENFGSDSAAIQHLTLRNFKDTALTAKLSFDTTNTPFLIVNPLDARCELVENPREVVVVRPTSAIEVCDVVPVSHLDEEIEFVRGWNSGDGEAEACLKTLTSLQNELAAGVRCRLNLPNALVSDEGNLVTLEIANRGKNEVTVFGLQAVNGVWLTLLDSKQTKIAPGRSATVSGMLSVETNAWTEIQWQLDLSKTNLVCSRVFKPQLIAAVTVTSLTEALTTVGRETYVELKLQNVTDRPRDVHIRWVGDFGNGQRDETVAPRSINTVRVPVKAEQSERGQLSVVVESGNKPLFQRRFGVTFLNGDASFARDGRARVEVDSTYAGYTIRPLTDGVRDTTGVAWNDAAWASDETGGPHWVKITFPDPTVVRALEIYWNIEGGVTYTSQRGTVVGWTEAGEKVTLGEFTNHQPVPATRIEFQPRKLKAIELLQPSRGGPETRPNLMWLSEIEVH